jgi:hypothetical protein
MGALSLAATARAKVVLPAPEGPAIPIKYGLLADNLIPVRGGGEG